MASKTLEIRWAVDDKVAERAGETLGPQAIGLDESDVAELILRFPGAVQLSTRPASIGVGASGVGLALVVEVERWLGDTANLIEVGAALWFAIRKVAQRHQRRAVVTNPDTLGALASTHLSSAQTDLRYSQTIPISRMIVGSDSDQRDVWATVFVDDRLGLVHLIFMSPSGTFLGTANVPAEAYFSPEWTVRTEDEIAGFWS
ncbi:MAG TPA: hypothetical protein VNA87_06480 [Actinomycetota bacterium]|nr:hypothetical protein [Actinomycetota bacterium]